MEQKTILPLKVMDALTDDVGQGIIRIGPYFMKLIKVKEND